MNVSMTQYHSFNVSDLMFHQFYYQNETPRINGKMLPQYMGRMVFLICDTSAVGQDQYGNQILRTTDGVEIVAVLPPGEQFER